MGTRTARRRHGDRAEQLVARYLESLGWTVMARNVVVGRDEVDIVALDPTPPRQVVCVEVRSTTTGRFGAPEETVVGNKVRRLYRSLAALRAAGALPSGEKLPWVASWRVDVVAVDDAPYLAPGVGGPRLRHLRDVEPD